MIWFLNGIHCKIDQKVFKKLKTKIIGRDLDYIV
jgi:hypothetical protein